MARPGERLAPVTLYADKEDVENTFRQMTRPWICFHCGKEFSLLESMGMLECHQHPGFVQEDGRWSCCGKRQYGAKWARNWPITKMYNDQCHPMPYQQLPKVRGCQKCDHNTSDAPYTHKDAKEIGDLSALLPAMNKEFPFHLRVGFENGVLRRCARRCIVVPRNAATVVYMNNSGEKVDYKVGSDTPVPEGIELLAVDSNGQVIEEWQ